ncbi:MAG: hypothetical protein DMG71_20820, partial [Acidobacteria bacterium]
HEALVTTDFSLEGVHFRRDWHPPDAVGHRCLTRGLSDIAAMGGEPLAAFLSLALPRKLPQAWVARFLNGFLKLARQFKVPLAGGDTAESPAGILADIVVLGSVPRGKAILRSGARPADRIYVSGELGAAAATLDLLRRSPKRKLRPADFPRHFHPLPRLELGRILREKHLASAMIDLSDGLSKPFRAPASINRNKKSISNSRCTEETITSCCSLRPAPNEFQKNLLVCPLHKSATSRAANRFSSSTRTAYAAGWLLKAGNTSPAK